MGRPWKPAGHSVGCNLQLGVGTAYINELRQRIILMLRIPIALVHRLPIAGLCLVFRRLENCLDPLCQRFTRFAMGVGLFWTDTEGRGVAFEYEDEVAL